MPTKYWVKYGRTIWHDDHQYNHGDVVELSEELALHHAPNIEVYRVQETSLTPTFLDDACAREAIEDAEREP